MRSRLFGPLGLCLLLVGVSALVAGGLGWVTVTALEVEQAQLDATVRADRANKERLALWRMDGHLLPALGLENNRPFAHYTALHAPYPAVDTQQDLPAANTLRLPSPLLSADLPPWMLLHFQLDPAAGWTSPQVLTPELVDRLRSAPFNWPLTNVSAERDRQLDRLRDLLPVEAALLDLDDQGTAGLDDSPLVVPVPLADDTAVSKPFGLAPGDPEPADVRSAPTDYLNNRTTAGLDRATRPGLGAGGGRGNTALLPPPAAAPAGPGGPPPLGTTPPPGMPGGGTFGGGFNPTPGGQPGPPQTSQAAGAQQQQLPYNLGKGPQGQAVPPADPEKQQEFLRRMSATLWSMRNRGGIEPGVKNNVNPTGNAPPAEKAGEQNADKTLAPGGGPAAPKPGSRDGKGLEEKGEAGKRYADPPAPGAPRRGAGGDEKKADPKTGTAKDEAATGRPAALAEAVKEARADGKLEAEAMRAELIGGPPDVRGAKKPAPSAAPVAVHLGPLRPHWLTARDGSEVLVLVRAARLEDRTVYQGVLLDWPLLRAALGEQVADLFPAAGLSPVRAAADLAPERAMTALPVQLDPGPDPDPAPAGWTPLRIGLALAWAAALIALAAVGLSGRALVSLSERRIRFVSAVTHELRTPLTSLRLYLDLLSSGMVSDEEKQKEYLRTLQCESERLHRLIENVLDFARLERRSVRATLHPTPVTELLDEARRTWSDRCAADEMELVVISTLPADRQVNTDGRMASQVLGNLIDNARKYCRGSADKRIWLWAKPGERGRVVLEVEDRGPGVPAAERTAIFKAFRRGEGADTTAGGAGLGLALAQQWSDLLGGEISYRPADGGVGACFRLELPGVV